MHGGTEVGSEREQGSRNGLRGAVAGEELAVRDPAGGHDGLLQKWEHDVPAAKHQRSGAVKAVEDGHRLIVRKPVEDGQPEQ